MNSKCLLNAYSFYFLYMHTVDYRIGIIEYVFNVSGICIFAWISVSKKKISSLLCSIYLWSSCVSCKREEKLMQLFYYFLYDKITTLVVNFSLAHFAHSRGKMSAFFNDSKHSLRTTHKINTVFAVLLF